MFLMFSVYLSNYVWFVFSNCSGWLRFVNQLYSFTRIIYSFISIISISVDFNAGELFAPLPPNSNEGCVWQAKVEKGGKG